ncbi:MAG: amino acid ABC transporter ATP-binding protein [Labilithrix sp.]|nr:amino acid ABC transporter ATP-binding protein [Labilithrix sp.]
MITVEKVSKRRGSRVILNEVSVTFERGKVTSVAGSSGSGKTTLLRCINGLERFDTGTIRVGDHEIAPLATGAAERKTAETLRRVRLEVGMVFQQYGLFSHMTALGNVMEAPIHVKGVAERQARERAEALLDQVGLSHRRGAFPRELSGGEQQRVAIARALAMEPKALLLDEPTAALDPERKAEIVKVLERLAKAGTTMVIVTHEPAVVQGVADRAIVLARGRLEA